MIPARKLLEDAATRTKAALPFRSRRRAKLAVVHARSYVGGAFSLPDFLVIGAMRAGTSSLFKHLARHPNLHRALRKEIDFFSNDFELGTRWYRAHFSSRFSTRLNFEATPYYLYHPHAARRAASVVPNAKLIVLVRDPVGRAVSHWEHMVRLGFESLSFTDAIEREESRIAAGWSELVQERVARSREVERYSYVARGYYAAQLDAWAEHFPRSSFLVLRFEDLIADTASVLSRIGSFLGVAPFDASSMRNYSQEQRPASYTKAVPTDPRDADTRVRLSATFALDQQRLSSWLAEPAPVSD